MSASSVHRVNTTHARLWFASTAVVVAIGLAVQIPVAATNDQAFFPTAAGRVFNVFCFFTIDSNIIVGVTCLLLALRLERASTTFRVFRLMGLVGITITGIVYHVAIARTVEFDGWGLIADQILHTVVPIAAVVGWLMFGPRGQISWRIAGLALLYPIVWIVFTLIRGPIVNWYPYHFIDVITLGYPKVTANSVWIALLFLAVSAGFHQLDGWLARIPDRRQ
jgi:hypothetical protein